MIRKMEERDVEALLEVDRICLHGRWNKEQFLYECNENPYAQVYVMERSDTILGFIDYWITFESGQLANIAILPAYQGKGYAKELMDLMQQACEDAGCENITLEVRVSNTTAIALYQSYGFIEVNRKKKYYNDNGEDAVYMIKPLGGNWV